MALFITVFKISIPYKGRLNKLIHKWNLHIDKNLLTLLTLRYYNENYLEYPFYKKKKTIKNIYTLFNLNTIYAYRI